MKKRFIDLNSTKINWFKKTKAVSDIIATILMLVITIGMAGTAYVYISGMLTSKIAATISISDYSCSLGELGNRTITLVISNDGTDQIPSGSLRIFVDNIDRTNDFGAYDNTGTWDIDNKDISPHTTKPILTNKSNDVFTITGTKTVLIVSTSNSQRVQVICP